MITAQREVDEAMRSNGFSHTTTGGGCTAYEKVDPAAATQLIARIKEHETICHVWSDEDTRCTCGIASAASILITVHGDPSAPTSIDDACDVGVYDGDGHQLSITESPDVWAALSEVQGPPR
jgi:hypothetical protein